MLLFKDQQCTLQGPDTRQIQLVSHLTQCVALFFDDD